MRKIISMCIVLTMLMCMVIPVSASNSFLVDESFSSYSGGNSISGWSVTAAALNLTAFDGPTGKAVKFSTSAIGEIMTKTFTAQNSGQILLTADVCVDTKSDASVYLANASSSQRTAISIENPEKVGAWTKINMLLDIQAKTVQSWFDDDYEAMSVSDFTIDSCSKLFFANWGTADNEGYIIIDNVKVTSLPQSFSVSTNGIHSSVYDVFSLEQEKSYSFKYENKDTDTRNITIECTAKDAQGNTISQKTFRQTVFSGKSYSNNFVFKLDYRTEGTVTIALKETSSDIVNYKHYKFICMNTNADNEVFSGNGGVNTHMGQGKSVVANAPLAMAMGVSVIRDGVDWWRIEATKGVYEFPSFADQMVNTLHNNGTQLLYILSYGNTLYSSNEKDIPIATASTTDYDYMDAWIDYVEQVVTRYRDKVDYWQVWNEPNIEVFNPSGATAAQYAELLKQSYGVIKNLDPTAKVVGGGLAGVGHTDTRPYLREMLKAGAGNYMDVLDVHPYKQSTDPENYMAERLPYIQADLEQYNCGDIEIWVGEIGWYTGTASDAITEEKQAAYSVRSRVLYDNFNRSEGKKGKFFWYDFQNDGTTQSYSEHNYGMTENNFTPKPVYYAYSAFNNIVGNKALRNMTQSSGIYQATYEDDTYVLWKESGEATKTLSFSGKTGKVYNMYGDLITSFTDSYNAEISENPVFVCVENMEKNIVVDSIEIQGNTIKVFGSTYPGADISVSLWSENAKVENLTVRNALDYLNGISEVGTDSEGNFEIEMPVNVKEARNYTLILSTKGCEQYKRIVTVGSESVALLKVTKNGVELKSLKDVQPGDKIKVQGNYYGDLPGALLIGKVQIDKTDFELQSVMGFANGKTSEEVEFTIGKDGLDSIDIFLWDGFTKLTPLYEKQTIK